MSEEQTFEQRVQKRYEEWTGDSNSMVEPFPFDTVALQFFLKRLERDGFEVMIEQFEGKTIMNIRRKQS